MEHSLKGALVDLSHRNDHYNNKKFWIVEDQVMEMVTEGVTIHRVSLYGMKDSIYVDYSCCRVLDYPNIELVISYMRYEIRREI